MLGTSLLIAAGAMASWSVWTNFLRPGHDLLRRYQKGSTKPWALVTGASDGMGKAFAIELAERGFNIILVSRTKSKLEAVEKLVKEAAPGTETHIVCIDFAKSDFQTVRHAVSDACRGRDVAMLINNAGMAFLPTPLHELDDTLIKEAENLIQVNVVAFTAVLRGVVPHMVARGHAGGVVNVSSASAHIGLPYNATYAASKGYNNLMSRTVGAELKEHNIDVISFTPLFVATNMVRRKPSFFVVTPQAAIRCCLRCLGFQRYTTGPLVHKLQLFTGQLFPSFADEAAVGMMKATRAKLLAQAKQD